VTTRIYADLSIGADPSSFIEAGTLALLLVLVTAACVAPADAILAQLDRDLLDTTENLYKDVHSHPELSMQEHRTAGLAAERLRASGFEVTEQVGGTGVVGLLRNGDGPTVMLRADMDALPVQEQTGLPYTSTTNGVMHACGHDMHVAWLAAAATLLAHTTEHWQGTLIALFQPGGDMALEPTIIQPGVSASSGETPIERA